MRIRFLWDTRPVVAWGIAALIGSPWYVLILAASSQQITPQYLSSVVFITAGVVLTYVFLARIRPERWMPHEAAILTGSVAIGAFGTVFSLVFLSPSREDAALILPISAGLYAFCHVAVRGFGYVQAVWARMRRRRLLWEIAHAQLRLVLIGMALVFVALMITQVTSLVSFGPTGLPGVVNAISMVLLLTGGVGVVTGVALLVFTVPASAISYLTARQITRRLEALVEAARALRRGDYSTRIPVEGEDEIAQLQTDFNAMAADPGQARADLEAERDAVMQLLESRRRLFADISHELRTPVATMRTLIEAADEPMPIMEREVLRMQRMIDDVFTLARTDIDQLRYEIKTVELGAILERTTRATKAQAWQSRKVDVVLDYKPQLPLVKADPERVEQILYNLLRNAVRHTMPGGFVRVSAQAARAEVRVQVADTGAGIAPEDLPHIWERFYRSAEARATDQGGAGLGLALVKEMTEAMGGSVAVESTPGEGSCFTVTFPRDTFATSS